MNTNSTSHCFPLNGNKSNPEIKGCEGILAKYTETINKLELSGLTYFLPVLQKTADVAKSRSSKKVYNVLLILTDGEIEDMDTVRNQIVKMSKLAVSVIVIGLGNGGFSKMRELDGDDKVLTNTSGQPGVRDIVQFVKFTDFDGKDAGLAAEVLKEIPEQFINYVEYKGL